MTDFELAYFLNHGNIGSFDGSGKYFLSPENVSSIKNELKVRQSPSAILTDRQTPNSSLLPQNVRERVKKYFATINPRVCFVESTDVLTSGEKSVEHQLIRFSKD